MTRKRIPIVDCYFGLICAFPIATMLIDGTIINKLLFASLVVIQIYLFFAKRLTLRSFLLIIFLILHYLFVILITDFPIANNNLLFYYPFFLVYTYFMCDNINGMHTYINRKIGFIKVVINIWTVLVGVSIAVPDCYYIKEGGGLYFGSWAGSIFRLGPSAMFIQVLAIILQTIGKQRYAVIYSLIPLYCVFMGSSRTYLFVGVCLFIISWYVFCGSKRKFWVSFVPLAALFLFLFLSSSILDKILYTLDEEQYGDFWFRLTSGRSDFWKKNLVAWNNMPLINKFFGSSIDFTYKTTGLWAHNDFIEILCSFGIVGVLQYMFAMNSIIRKSWSGSRIPLSIKFSVVLVWLFNAFFNMHYVYFCAMLCYPFLTITIGSFFKTEND